MGKTILGYILGFTFSFLTIFEGMYLLSRFYPELFRPIPRSGTIPAVIDSVNIKDESPKIAWEDTSSIGFEYIEIYKFDSLKNLHENTLMELKKYKDSVIVLNAMVKDLKTEVARKDLILEKLQQQVSNQQSEKIKSLAKIYEVMEPESAARIIENMPEDEALAILLNMQRRQAAKILAEINAKKAIKLSKISEK
ncbi:MAG: hypothetical protein RMJ81_02190 [Candidatus Kryptonium sp.]|nr:hypothetical protein [Candidatus Kryptonium sp.]MCX7763106.1 hypothetical protein [Candidatus Kryptonium sp.]MDW8108447.1 hypothetical protein [Candidatus Kryptonium sp.]